MMKRSRQRPGVSPSPQEEKSDSAPAPVGRGIRGASGVCWNWLTSDSAGPAPSRMEAGGKLWQWQVSQPQTTASSSISIREDNSFPFTTPDSNRKSNTRGKGCAQPDKVPGTSLPAAADHVGDTAGPGLQRRRWLRSGLATTETPCACLSAWQDSHGPSKLLLSALLSKHSFKGKKATHFALALKELFHWERM